MAVSTSLSPTVSLLHLSDTNVSSLKKHNVAVAQLPSNHLPPKHLKRPNRTRSLLSFLYLATFISFIAIILAFRFKVYDTSGRFGSALSDGLCDKQSAPKGAEKFTIDVRFGGDYTFPVARSIDLVWDMVIGQGGRYFHAWILAHIAMDSLVVTMERSAVPYHYYVALSFTTVSWHSLWSILKIICRRRAKRTVLTAIALFFCILYLLAFPTIWSAATGYITPSRRAYRMPDNSLVTLDNDEFNLCYVVEDKRMGWDTPHTEIGPSFSDLEKWQLPPQWREPNTTLKVPVPGQSNTEELFSVEFFEDMMNPGPAPPDNIPFLDIAYYKLASEPLQAIANSSGWYLEGKKEKIAAGSPYDPWGAYDAGHPRRYSGSGTGGGYYFNETITPGPGVIPFNSTLYYMGINNELDAPFVKFHDACLDYVGFNIPISCCVCWRSQPLTYTWWSTENMACISDKGYSWGFSSFVTLVALALETAWIGICFILRVDASLNSHLLRYRRSGYGILRSVLDLSEAVRREIGECTSAYTDFELSEVLKTREDVGFSVDDSGALPHIEIVPEGLKNRPLRALVSEDEKYR